MSIYPEADWGLKYEEDFDEYTSTKYEGPWAHRPTFLSKQPKLEVYRNEL